MGGFFDPKTGMRAHDAVTVYDAIEKGYTVVRPPSEPALPAAGASIFPKPLKFEHPTPISLPLYDPKAVPTIAGSVTLFLWLPAVLWAVFFSDSFVWVFAEFVLIAVTALTVVVAMWEGKRSVESKLFVAVLVQLSLGAAFFKLLRA